MKKNYCLGCLSFVDAYKNYLKIVLLHDSLVVALHVRNFLVDGHHLALKSLVPPDHVVQCVDGEHGIQGINVLQLFCDPVDGVVTRLLELLQLQLRADLALGGLASCVQACPKFFNFQQGGHNLE